VEGADVIDDLGFDRRIESVVADIRAAKLERKFREPRPGMLRKRKPRHCIPTLVHLCPRQRVKKAATSGG
jgi:hypothetical protein